MKLIRNLLFIVFVAIMATACDAGQLFGLTMTPTSTNIATAAPGPIATAVASTPTIAQPPSSTATPNVEATKQAKQAAHNVLKKQGIDIKLDSPEDFATLPVLDDKLDFDTGKVQEETYWLIDNVLPPADDIKLPTSYRSSCNKTTGVCIMTWDHIAEPNIKAYRFVGAFFVMRDGVKMLRIGLEYGGPRQLVYINFENPSWWTDSDLTDLLLKAVNLNGRQFYLMDNHVAVESDKNLEPYSVKVMSERVSDGDQLIKYWIENHQLPEDADKTIFSAIIAPYP